MEKQMGNETVAAVGGGKAALDEAGDGLAVSLRTPIRFEGELYEKIDLSGLHDIKAADMVAINRRLARSGNVDAMQELTLEYAMNMANIVTGLPLEFFEQLPPYAALALRGCVAGFLFRQE